MKIYVTKYALTKGIYEAEASILHNGKMASVNVPGYCASYFHTNEFHFTLNDAQEHANTIRHKKIQSLEKQIKKLYALKF